MRALLEATLKAENAARLQAEDRARALEPSVPFQRWGDAPPPPWGLGGG